MGAEIILRKSYNAVKNGYNRFVIPRKFKKEIDSHLRNNKDDEIPHLSKEQQNEVESFWGKYGISLSSLEWHRFYYSKAGIEDPRFVPEDVFHQIIRPRMNDIHLAAAWSDKAFTDWVVRDVKTVNSVVRCVNGRLLDENYRLINVSEADRILNSYEALVIKPTMFTDTGKNVVLQNAPFDVSEIALKYGKYFVIQIPLKQHREYSKLNESSVNTLRIDTVLFDDRAFAVSAFIKVGQPGEFTDNGGGANRIFIGIRNGRFTDFAYDHDCNKTYQIPSKYEFAGKTVPFFNEMCEAVEKAHSYIPHFGLAFWDVAVDENGEPTIVEMNLRYPDTHVPQVGSGPFFGEYTEEVLKYINKNK